MRELASVVLQVLRIVNHEEGVGQVDLGDTVSVCEGVIHAVACELVLIGDLDIKSQLESDVIQDTNNYRENKISNALCAMLILKLLEPIDYLQLSRLVSN